jgi:uncharacterized protein
VRIPEAVGYVNDVARVMNDDERAKLEAFLDQVEKKTGAEFAVLVVPTTAPLQPDEYKVRVFERWKLGKKGSDEGLLMLVAIAETSVRFETGYGLEGTLPDGLESRIYRQVIRPHFLEHDLPGGIREGVLACSAIIAKEKGVTLEWDGRELRYTGRRSGGLGSESVILLLVGFGLLSVIMNNLRRRRGSWWGGPGGFGGWGGGYGGWGGGFGGGGGGSSFGGFGGGSSGGGGGGGGGSGGW